jgi:hypothetical protein
MYAMYALSLGARAAFVCVCVCSWLAGRTLFYMQATHKKHKPLPPPHAAAYTRHHFPDQSTQQYLALGHFLETLAFRCSKLSENSSLMLLF